MKFEPAYNFYQLQPGIFLLEVDGNCDLAMTFLRGQEFYESVNDDIRGHQFTMEQYQEWYKTQSKTGDFSYGEDWRGFNLPSKAIDECYALNKERLPTDEFFLKICGLCEDLSKDDNLQSYYFLGVRKGATDTLEHEIAHGLFTTNPKYKKDMLDALSQINPLAKQYIFDCLHKMGYADTVHEDEAQAFLSTGLNKTMTDPSLPALTENFVKIFQSYIGDWKLPSPLVEKISSNSSLKIKR